MRYSVERNASKPISVGGLFLDQLPITRQGATEFTFSRWLVPWLMDYEGIGVFFDEDQVCVGDIWELFSYCKKLPKEWDVAVRVNDQPQYEWPSVMVFNNKNLTNLTPSYIDDESNSMFDFGWTTPERIAQIPDEWNHCVGQMPSREDAKLYHYTQGIPYWPECRGLPEDKFWFNEFEELKKSVDWIDLHAGTKHFGPVMTRFLKQNYGITIQQQ